MEGVYRSPCNSIRLTTGCRSWALSRACGRWPPTRQYVPHKCLSLARILALRQDGPRPFKLEETFASEMELPFETEQRKELARASWGESWLTSEPIQRKAAKVP